MGSERVREIKATLKTLGNIENKKGYEFQRVVNRIKALGTSDYELKKAYVYRENFMNELEDLKNNYTEFEKVFEFFNNIQQPITFFNTTQKSRALQDFFLWYKTPENYAGFDTVGDLVEDILEKYRGD